MVSNGSPEQWRQRDDWKYGKPRKLTVSERPPLDPDPLHVELPEPRRVRDFDNNDVRIAKLVAAGLVLLTILLVIREALP